jgi:hypothetical protein
VKVRVVSVGGGQWRWEIVAGNGAVVGASVSTAHRNVAIRQAGQVAGPLRLIVKEPDGE